MRIIAIINQKGGCGKTTTGINLAACLARLGQKTLLVDMDPQGHCGVGLAVPEDQIERTIYDTLIEPSDGKPAKLSEIVWQIASDFDLAPSNIKLAAFEQIFAGRPGREDRLLKAMDTVRQTYDWVVIDCPPSVGLLTFNALRACDEVLVPVETGFFSLHGLAKVMETLELLKERVNKDVLIRVLPTLYDTRTKLAREVLQELRAKFRDYLMESTINFNTKLKEAASFGQPITEYDPGSRGYKDFVNLARELMGHRPVDIEPVTNERLSRPAELVQRARQLAQLTNYQFGRGTIKNGPAAASETPATPVEVPQLATATSGPNGNGNGFASLAELARSGATPVAFSNRRVETRAFGEDETHDANEPEHAPPRIAGQIGINANGAAAPAQAPAKTIEQKLEEFYGVKQEGEEVLFAANFATARKVMIAGDFNNWTPISTPMLRSKEGTWQMRLPLPSGRYRYRLVVDGKWMTDPNNNAVETNQFGELNNVVEVA
ncbi:MAG: Sporulation initiation inhibitor protein soj [Phycisphaerales bacterium]|nr:Sporulation initiation inhibitor protein soj [Phycisphaerales bacterium]